MNDISKSPICRLLIERKKRGDKFQSGNVCDGSLQMKRRRDGEICCLNIQLSVFSSVFFDCFWFSSQCYFPDSKRKWKKRGWREEKVKGFRISSKKWKSGKISEMKGVTPYFSLQKTTLTSKSLRGEKRREDLWLCDGKTYQIPLYRERWKTQTQTVLKQIPTALNFQEK